MDDIREIAECAKSYLKTGGRLLLEHGYDQADAVRDLLESSGYIETNQFQDLGGWIRVTAGKKST